MSEPGHILDYTGTFSWDVINTILKSLKDSKELGGLGKTTGKRTYAVVNECLENIVKHSSVKTSSDPGFQPFISASVHNGKVVIKSGNQIPVGNIENLASWLDRINQMEYCTLSSFFEEVINRAIIKDENGTGLGFIMMKLKSGNNIGYRLTGIDSDNSFLELDISINKYS